jgi:hypothetical protein
MTRTAAAHKAHSAVQYALEIGKLTRPDRCSNAECGKVGKVEAAHESYDAPLSVKWLCRSCHRKWDRAQPKGGTMETPAVTPQFKDRIKELRRVTAKELLANPLNWRTHPGEQSSAMLAVLREVGIAGAAIAYEAPDGSLTLIDGHLRHELISEQPIPVLVLDVSEEEANLLLATFDPLSAMANQDSSKLLELLEEQQADSAVLQAMLERMGQQAADDLLQAAAASEAPEDDADQQAAAAAAAAASDQESEYSTFTVPLTLAQEQSVRRALRLARGKYGIEKTGDALAKLAELWLAENPE